MFSGGTAANTGRPAVSDKISERHRARTAILYIRQSTLQQVQHNEESRRLQYAMRERLVELGWHDIEIIDDDLGRSAGGAVQRAGFQRLVATVSLGEVGAVAARELSRFARNSRDWQKLMEVCRYVDTLLVDQDAVYDTRQSNDRLLLGLKGSLNEYELDLLRLRGLEARREKAKRGEFLAKIAVGYRKTEDGQLEMTPDVRVQQAIHLAFDKCLELGSVRQALLWLHEHELKVPINRNHRGEVVWKAPAYGWLHQVVTNPIYAGAYVYGRSSRKLVMRDGEPHHRVVRVPRAEWSVLHRDHHPAYIDWERFERIQSMLTRNSQTRRATAAGAAKKGAGLLAGLVRCRRCGHKLLVNYSGDGSVHRYACQRGSTDRGENNCLSFSGLDVDDQVGRALVAVLRPAAIEASLRAALAETQARDEVVEALALELKAARYTAERAFRQYDAVDPENRLVADELETRWNQALEYVRELDDRIQAAQRQQPSREPPGTDTFRAAGETFSRVWNDAATDIRLKKRLLRALVEEIVADLDETAAEIVLLVHWKGGVHSELRVRKRRRGDNRIHTPPDVVEAIRTLALVCPDEEIAAWLNKAELRTGKGNRWTRALVTSLRSSRNIAPYSPERCEAEGWITLERAAALVGIASLTLRRAIARGVIAARQPVPRGPWILRRQDLSEPNVRDRLLKKPRAARHEGAAPASAQIILGFPRR
jgi:DNA invertase Pin-like site-specific DNA recombinase